MTLGMTLARYWPSRSRAFGTLRYARRNNSRTCPNEVKLHITTIAAYFHSHSIYRQAQPKFQKWPPPHVDLSTSRRIIDHHPIDYRPNAPRCRICRHKLKAGYVGLLAELCHLCRRKTLRWDFQQAPDWDTLVRYSMLHLEGMIDVAFNWDDHVEEETYPWILDLLQLHKLGVMTMSSQLATTDYYQVPEEVVHYSQMHIFKYYAVKRRAFLDLVIPTVHRGLSTSTVDQLIQKILEHPALDVFVWSLYEEYPYVQSQLCAPLRQLDTFQHNNLHTTIPLNRPNNTASTIYQYRANNQLDGYHVNKIKEGYSIEKCNDAPWEERGDHPLSGFNGTCFDLAQTPVYLEGVDGEGIPAARAARPLFVHMASKDWDSDVDLPKLLLELCNVLGISAESDVV